MKKYVFLLPVILLPLLTSCSKEKEALTYGTYVDANIASLIELRNEQLLVKSRYEEETLTSLR